MGTAWALFLLLSSVKLPELSLEETNNIIKSAEVLDYNTFRYMQLACYETCSLRHAECVCRCHTAHIKLLEVRRVYNINTIEGLYYNMHHATLTTREVMECKFE